MNKQIPRDEYIEPHRCVRWQVWADLDNDPVDSDTTQGIMIKAC